jgi:hypothetical protein
VQVRQGGCRHVRNGSKADIGDYSGDVRFTPNSGHRTWTRITFRRSNSGSLAMYFGVSLVTALGVNTI